VCTLRYSPSGVWCARVGKASDQQNRVRWPLPAMGKGRGCECALLLHADARQRRRKDISSNCRGVPVGGLPLNWSISQAQLDTKKAPVRLAVGQSSVSAFTTTISFHRHNPKNKPPPLMNIADKK